MLKRSSWIKALLLGLSVTIATPTHTGFWNDTWQKIQPYWQRLTALIVGTGTTIAAYFWWKKQQQEKSEEKTTTLVKKPLSAKNLNVNQTEQQQHIEQDYNEMLNNPKINLLFKKIVTESFKTAPHENIQNLVPKNLQSIVRITQLNNDTIAVLYIPYPYLFNVTKDAFDSVWTDKHGLYSLGRISGTLHDIQHIKNNIGNHGEEIFTILSKAQNWLIEKNSPTTIPIKQERHVDITIDNTQKQIEYRLQQESTQQGLSKPVETAYNKKKIELPENFKKMLTNIVSDSKQYWKNAKIHLVSESLNKKFFVTPTITKNTISAAYLPYPYIFNVTKDKIEILSINKDAQSTHITSKIYNLISTDFDREIAPQLGRDTEEIKKILDSLQKKLQKNFAVLQNYSANSANQQSLVIDGSNNETYIYTVAYTLTQDNIPTIQYLKHVIYPLHESAINNFAHKNVFFDDITNTIQEETRNQKHTRAILNNAKQRLKDFAAKKEHEIAKALPR